MENLEGTPGSRKYPLRKRTKVTYDDYVSPTKKRSKKPAKDNTSSEDETDEEKENASETEDESIQEISEYEKIRLKNIEENRRVMMELGLIDPLKEQRMREAESQLKLKKTTKPKKKPQKPKVIEPQKRSLRLMAMTPEGKKMPLDILQDTPTDSPVVPERTRIEEETLPMTEDGETVDFLDSIKSSLSQDSGISSIYSTDSLIDDLRKLKLADYERVTPTRTQSLCIHPMEHKLLLIGGSKSGEIGLWSATEGSVVHFNPHLRPVNCISVSADDNSKVFTTSHDGTLRQADLNKSVFDLAYQSDEQTDMCHLTWHSQVDANTLLIAHGTGDVGVVDLRSKGAQRWFHCHPRSVRTTHIHPTQHNYFLSSSGSGECKIWDLRGKKKDEDEHVADLSILQTKKGLTSAFFSPDGKKIVQTCNDDSLRFYDSSDISAPQMVHRELHNNHTGRWLSVFKAVFHPLSSDFVFVGSMLQPRRIQIYNSCRGGLVRELRDEDCLTTVVPVLALHPTQPVVAGGNSSGKVYVFTTKHVRDHLIKQEHDDDSS